MILFYRTTFLTPLLPDEVDARLFDYMRSREGKYHRRMFMDRYRVHRANGKYHFRSLHQPWFGLKKTWPEVYLQDLGSGKYELQFGVADRIWGRTFPLTMMVYLFFVQSFLLGIISMLPGPSKGIGMGLVALVFVAVCLRILIRGLRRQVKKLVVELAAELEFSPS